MPIMDFSLEIGQILVVGIVAAENALGIDDQSQLGQTGGAVILDYGHVVLALGSHFLGLDAQIVLAKGIVPDSDIGFEHGDQEI